MDFPVLIGDIVDQEVDVAVINLFSGVKTPGGAAGAVDRALGGLVSKLISAGEIRGVAGELTLIHTLGDAYPGFKPERVLVAGLGEPEEFGLDEVRTAAGSVARKLRALRARKAATVIHGAGAGGLNAADCAEAIVEGALLGQYRFDRYVSSSSDDDHAPELQSLALVEMEPEKAGPIKAAAKRARVLAKAAALARDMVNEPPNSMSPSRMAEIAAEAATREDALECRILERRDAERLGMGALLGVAQGSREPLRIIELSYAGDPEDPDNNLWLVGKGITFDSGGLSLKPTSGMATMKSDMAGGAAVIAAARAIAQLRPRINVRALVLATENMPGGGAQRVGDIVRAMNGTTIEVVNTDAEGRLTLADALSYAVENGARRIVDVATLTGGIVVALGSGLAGLFSNNDALANAIAAAGARRGEPVWRLPLDSVSKKQNESKVADIKNSGGRPAHAATGAHFIGTFAGDAAWAHLDIAGTAMAKETTGWKPEGATGVPTRSLVQLALDLGSAREAGRA